MPPPSRGPGPHARLEDDLHLSPFFVRGGHLGGRFLRGFLLPRKIGKIGEIFVLIGKLDIFPY
jgi:hypothetical protein